MAEFASPVDAVEAAMKFKKITLTSAEINDGIVIKFRIGINLGDIMVQDNNLYGDNVNIAARLESISKPKEICISEKVFQEIKNKVNVNFNFIGTKKLKNISEKINVYSSNISGEEEKKFKNTIPTKKILIGFLMLTFLVFLGFFSYKYFSTEKINYSGETINTINDYKASEDLKTNNTISESNIIKISLMNFKNQSKTFDGNNLNDLLDSIQLTLSEKDVLTSSL